MPACAGQHSWHLDPWSLNGIVSCTPFDFVPWLICHRYYLWSFFALCGCQNVVWEDCKLAFPFISINFWHLMQHELVTWLYVGESVKLHALTSPILLFMFMSVCVSVVKNISLGPFFCPNICLNLKDAENHSVLLQWSCIYEELGKWDQAICKFLIKNLWYYGIV